MAQTPAQAVADRFYRAMAEDDGPALASLLHPAFTGRVSAGMPLGVGGSVDGPDKMLRGVWLTIAKAFDVTPVTDEIVPIGDDRVVAFGFYRGSARDTGRDLTAAFAHDIVTRDGQMLSLVQITDTSTWHATLT